MESLDTIFIECQDCGDEASIDTVYGDGFEEGLKRLGWTHDPDPPPRYWCKDCSTTKRGVGR